MNLHIELDKNHPAYKWLEEQADKIGAIGHLGTHIDCYTTVPSKNEFILPACILDCRYSMPTVEAVSALPTLADKALILHTGNMYRNDYGSAAYFNDTDTSLSIDVLKEILEKSPQLILIDSYGIGRHGQHHIERDKMCEDAGCFVIENIRIVPEEIKDIHNIKINFDLDYPSSGKPCRVTY